MCCRTGPATPADLTASNASHVRGRYIDVRAMYKDLRDKFESKRGPGKALVLVTEGGQTTVSDVRSAVQMRAISACRSKSWPCAPRLLSTRGTSRAPQCIARLAETRPGADLPSPTCSRSAAGWMELFSRVEQELACPTLVVNSKSRPTEPFIVLRSKQRDKTLVVQRRAVTTRGTDGAGH